MLRRLRTRVIRKSAFVVLLLATVMGFTVEPVVGTVRDGDVHHETALEAASHFSLAAADHSHEQSELPAPADSDGGHEHGSNSDHCTHAHGMAHPTMLSFELFTTSTRVEASYFQPVHSVPSTCATPPPNA